MKKLTRKQESTIFKTRTRMLKVKGNYKNGFPDLTCRACKKEDETQAHILYECDSLHRDDPITNDDHDNHDNTETPEINTENPDTTTENLDNITDDTRWHDIFNEDPDELKKTANQIEKIMDNLTTCFDK